MCHVKKREDKCFFEILTVCSKNKYEISNSIGLRSNKFLPFLEHIQISYVHGLVIKDRFNMSSFKSNQM